MRSTSKERVTKDKEIESISDAYETFERLNIHTPEKRKFYHFLPDEKKKRIISIRYSSVTTTEKQNA